MKNARVPDTPRTAQPLPLASPAASSSLPAQPGTPALPGTPAQPGQPGHLETTRARVAEIILASGPQTAAALAEELALTPAAVRRHLEAMVADGTVEAREHKIYTRRGRGRPAKVFALTDAGRDAFYQAYDDLALSALRYIRETAGEQAVAEFARRMVARFEVRYRETAQTCADGPGTAALAEALSADGYAASVQPAQLGEQLCQHHCPVAHVAAQFPELCEAETELFSRILGRHVQRLATIAHGDGVCTTHVPDPDLAVRLQQAHEPEHPAPQQQNRQQQSRQQQQNRQQEPRRPQRRTSS